MGSLAVFDFDRTIVDDDSDATVISRLRETPLPPAGYETSDIDLDWTPYMSSVFEYAYAAGLSQGSILDGIASMRPSPGALRLISTLSAEGWDVLLITDANSVFVQHWLKAHGLLKCVTAVITNRAFWESGRLYIEPCMRQSACTRCPSNLCKSAALAQWCAGGGGRGEGYERIVYCGDGRNDYCPATSLPPHGTVFPRRGYPLDRLIMQTLATASPQVKAKVVPWDDCFTILREIFPDKPITVAA